MAVGGIMKTADPRRTCMPPHAAKRQLTRRPTQYAARTDIYHGEIFRFQVTTAQMITTGSCERVVSAVRPERRQVETI
jgi:hypothetical protein